MSEYVAGYKIGERKNGGRRAREKRGGRRGVMREMEKEEETEYWGREVGCQKVRKGERGSKLRKGRGEAKMKGGRGKL